MMRDCENGEMRDLLPGYVHGTISEAEHAAVEAHLRTCADCTAEVKLIESAARAYPAPVMNVDRIMKAIPTAPETDAPGWMGAAVIGGIATGRPDRLAKSGSRSGWLVAASIAGALLVGATRLYLASNPTQVVEMPSANVPLPAIVKPLKTPESTTVAAAPAPAAAAPAAPRAIGSGISFGGGLSDLTDDQLDTLLGELDALEALPSSEPETHLSPIVPQADGGHGAR